MSISEIEYQKKDICRSASAPGDAVTTAAVFMIQNYCLEI